MVTSREKVFQFEVESLKLEIEKAKKNIPGFRSRRFNKAREKELIFILEQAVDLAEGCLLLADSKLSVSCSASARVLLEYLFWACWVAQTVDNAEKYSQRATGEMKRNMTKVLREGYAKVTRRGTNEDITQEFLDSDLAKNLPKKIEIKRIAEDTGLEKIYTAYYGFLATTSHGGLYGLEASRDKDESILADLAFANVALTCIHLVVDNWISKRQQTPTNQIIKIMRA